MTKDWFYYLSEFLLDPQMNEIFSFLRQRRKVLGNNLVFPSDQLLFEPFNYCSPQEIKVVFVGGVPHPYQVQNTGLAFDFPKEESAPYITQEIFREYHRTKAELDDYKMKKYEDMWKIEQQIESIQSDLDELMDEDDHRSQAIAELDIYTDELEQELSRLNVLRFKDVFKNNDNALAGWASQGVLLLNACMTTEISLNQHKEKHWGMWSWFVNSLLAKLSTEEGIYFYLKERHGELSDSSHVIQEYGNWVETSWEMPKDDILVDINRWIEEKHGVKKTIDWSLGLDFLDDYKLYR